MKVGDIVKYINDWIPNRQWYLYSLSKGDICKIVLIRNGKITYEKNGVTHLNANIANLNINKIEPYGEIYLNNN